MYKNCIKRLFDIVFSLLGMIILSPLFLGVALAIKLMTEDLYFSSSSASALKSRCFGFINSEV